MAMVVNLTGRPATAEQVEMGVFDLEGEALEELKRQLLFESWPDFGDIERRADAIAELAQATDADNAMVGGPGFMVSALERELKSFGIVPVHYYEMDVAIAETAPGGSVGETTVYRRGLIRR